jgi:hypothetical protein
MKVTLTSRYGFDERNIVVLRNREATNAAILAAVEKLVSDSGPDDVAVFYYAGHGSQVRNVGSKEHDKLDESLVPWDSRSGASDIRDKEIAARLVKAKAGVHFTVILDSCHSGSATRGVLRLRKMEPDARAQVNDTSEPDAGARVLTLSAAQDYQPAAEAKDDAGRPHGAFTSSLLRALNSLPPSASATAVFLAAREDMRARGFYQEPVLEGPAPRKTAPFLGPKVRGASGRPVAAVAEVEGGKVTLRAGTATGVGPGSVFVRSAPSRLKLVVTSADFLTCVAEPESASASLAGVEPGAIFELEKLAPPREAALRVQVASPPPDAQAVLAAARELGKLRSDDVVWVDDPSRVVPTHVVRYAGGAWALEGPAGAVAALGAAPTAAGVRAALAKMPPAADREEPCSAKPCLFVRLPPPAKLVADLRIGREAGDAIRMVERDADADYVLAGRVGPGGAVEYAWIRLVATRSSCRDAAGKVLEAATQDACARAGGRMLVANAPPPATLPPRSNFVALGAASPAPASAPSAPSAAAEELERYVTQIARVSALLRLNGPPGEDLFPYRLALRKKGTDELVSAGVVRAGTYDLVIAADGDVERTENRWVYVLSLQSDGAIYVLYPRSNVENRFPRGDSPQRVYALNGPAIQVGEPYGTDTLVLIASKDPVPGLGALEQGEVLAKRTVPSGTRGGPGSSALADLLVDQAARTRGARPAPTADWSIGRVEFETRP